MKMKKLISTLLALSMLLSAAPSMALAAGTDEGLVLNYTFDADSAVPERFADSVSGIDGLAQNTVPDGWSPNQTPNEMKVAGGFASFPGGRTDAMQWGDQSFQMYTAGAAIKIPEELKTKITGDYTVSLWMRPDADASGLMRLFDFGIGEKDSIFLRYNPETGEMRFQDRAIGNSADDENSLISANVSDIRSKWSLVTVTYSAGEKKAAVYINGAELMSGNKFTRSISDLGALTNETYGLYIGRTQWYANRNENQKNPDFKGYMDDVRIYNRALGAEEAAALYSETKHDDSLAIITSSTEISVSTDVGAAPVLPETVKVTFDNGETANIAVAWEAIDAASYAEPGKFTVRGSADGYGRIFAAIVTVKAQSLIDEDLMVYYDFDDDEASPTQITDKSGRANHGEVLNNGQSGSRERKITISDGTAVFPGVYVDRRGRVSVGAAIKIPDKDREAFGNYTVSMWVKADGSYQYAGAYQRFFDFGVSTTESTFVRYVASTGDLRFQDRSIGSSSDDPKSYMSVTNNAFTDRWGLLTVTYDRGTVTVYVNGKQVMRESKFNRSIGDDVLEDTDHGMFLGRTQWYKEQLATNPDFCGRMDEFRLYDRALTADEVAQLYRSTNPEPVVEVPVSYTLTDGTVIGSDSVTLGEGARYTHTAPETIAYEGVTYNLSTALSSLTVDSASASSKITGVYVVRAVSGAEKVSVRTYKGVAPKLPDFVTLNYNTGEAVEAAVEWEEIAPEKYADSGRLIPVKGRADGFEVTASVVVYGVEAVHTPENIYLVDGEELVLPNEARVSFTDGVQSNEKITWETVPSVGTDHKSAVAEGYLTNYPDVRVSTAIEVIIKARKNILPEADTYTESGSGDKNYGNDDNIKITYKGGENPAGQTRHGFYRFSYHAEGKVLEAKLRLYVVKIDNPSYVTYSVYATDNDWDESELTWNTQQPLLDAKTEALDTVGVNVTTYPFNVNDYIEFDVTDYVNSHPDAEALSFIVQSDTAAAYLTSRESEENQPMLTLTSEGREITVNYVSGGKTVYSESVTAPKDEIASFTGYRKYVGGSDGIYAADNGTYPLAASAETIDIPVTPAESFELENTSVTGYVGEEILPDAIQAVINGSETSLPIEFDKKSFDSCGTFRETGKVGNFAVSVKATVYVPYYNSYGKLEGYGSIVKNKFVDKNGVRITDDVVTTEPVGKTYSPSDVTLAYWPQLKNPVPGEPFELTDPEHEAIITAELIDGVSGRAEAEISGKDEADYTLTFSAAVANTSDKKEAAKAIIVKYNPDGSVKSVLTDTAELEADMTGRKTLSLEIGYDRASGEDIRAYLWDGYSLRPLAAAVNAADIEVPRFSDEVLALIPEYGAVKENVLRANNYWQNNNSYRVNSFWDNAAYHTGNMEAYFTFGNPEYEQYSRNWAGNNSWKGNFYSGNKSDWTWGYTGDQYSTGVLFGDWQICFQTYLDLYLTDPENSDLSRVREVIDYQITKENDDFWWWADALYMVPPVYAKLYKLTGNEDYLDAMYKYYRFSMELMFDGEGGIPTSADGYTTGAKSYKKSGSNYSDPEKYTNLFYRDAGYAYPLNPNSGHESEKNFWARGNGWVFAGLAKIIADMPSDYEHYGYFVSIYQRMAKAIIDCQKLDGDGNGFWTQSMLQNYPIGNNGNDEGYETSGTAFFSYGLFWGLNSGLLDEKTYLEPALRSWKYLSEVALLDSGRVGYVQPIGSNATSATPRDTTQNFGVGAFLLAGCEVSRWVDGVSDNNTLYLSRKLQGSAAMSGSKYYVNGRLTEGAPTVNDNGTLYVPVADTAALLGFEAISADGGYELSAGTKVKTLAPDAVINIGGTDCASAEALAEAMGKHVSTFGDITVISHKKNIFYGCEKKCIECLKAVFAE